MKIVKNDDDTVIYGITPNKLYKVLGIDEKGNYLVRNNSGEIISIYQKRATMVE